MALVHRCPAPAFLRARALVVAGGLEVQLSLELAVALQPLRRQRAGGDRRPHRAARFGLVHAVAKLALGRQLLHVVEGLGDALVGLPQLHHPHPRGVDDAPAAGQRDQLTVGGRVSAAAVVADLARGQPLLVDQPVDQRRLAHAGRPHRGRGAAAPNQLAQLIDALTGDRRDHLDRHPGCHRVHAAHSRRHVVADVGLGQDDHRVGTALPGHGQVPLDPARVEILVQRRHQQRQIHVGRHHLLGGDLAGRVSHKRRPPGQHRGYLDALAVRIAVVRDPVSDRRSVDRGTGCFAHRAGHLGPAVAAGDGKHVRTAVLDDHAARLETGGCVGFEGGCPVGIPPIAFEIHSGLLSHGKRQCRLSGGSWLRRRTLELRQAAWRRGNTDRFSWPPPFVTGVV